MSDMAQVTELSPFGVPWKVRPAFVAKDSIAWVFIGGIFKYVLANFSPVLSRYFEAYYRATTGTAYARLYDVTADSAVGGSAVNTASTALVRQRSGALALTDGDEYRAQFGKASGDAGAAVDAKVIFIAP